MWRWIAVSNLLREDGKLFMKAPFKSSEVLTRFVKGVLVSTGVNI